jgi:hypothetical protein
MRTRSPYHCSYNHLVRLCIHSWFLVSFHAKLGLQEPSYQRVALLTGSSKLCCKRGRFGLAVIPSQACCISAKVPS